MEKAELLEFIRSARDKDKKEWNEIADLLKKRGYKSPRTRQPITSQTVRYIYSYGFRRFKNQGHARSEETTFKAFINQIVSSTTLAPDQKIEMLKIYLSQHGGQEAR